MALGRAKSLVGECLGAKYTILRRIGGGSMGAVYEARTDDGVHVAIKILSAAARDLLGDEALARFVRESTISSGIRSNHVVPVIDSGVETARNIAYLVMQLLTGEDLEKLVERTG